MNIERKLLFYIFLIPVIGMIVGMSGGMYLLNYSSSSSKMEGSIFLKKREIKLQKEKLKLLVQSVIHDIEILKLTKKNYLEKIKELYPAQKDKYIFIYKIHNLKGGSNFGTMILNTNRPDLVGKTLDDNYTDINNFAFRKQMLKFIRRDNFAYIKYFYKKPKTNKIEEKISYFQYYAPLKIIVASGIYLDDIDEVISQYKTHLDILNKKVLYNFIIISMLIFAFILIFTFAISRLMLKEFEKFRKKIKLNEKKLRYKLYIDELTKLKSRKSLVEDVEKGYFSCLILIDIDNFRNINQFYGAETGDVYLQQFAFLIKDFRKIIHNSIRVYRMGSDEFAIAIKNSDYKETKEIAEKLYNFLASKKIHINSEIFDVDTTIVFSDFPNPIRKTLITLAVAKKQHKNILSYAEIKYTKQEEQFFEMKKMLKTAIKENQIVPFAQGIVNDKKELIKYELLMRIVTKDKVIPPYFLEYAKQAKLYKQISSIMIDKCFEFIKTTNVLCSINIDMQDIIDEDMVAQLKQNVINLNKPVVFEILESESFQNYEELKVFIKEFKSYGVLFAIDDFGSGYSNYSEILELKPDYLKIDGSLIKNINQSKENLVLIESILFFTHMLELKTTAEFVEDEKIYKKLRALGIDEFQGYYFHKPMPLDQLDKNIID